MLSEERVKLMTRMASFEDNEGKEYASASTHFRGDYVGAQVLKAVICATIAYMIVFGVYIYYNYETLMTDIYKMDIWERGNYIIGQLKKLSISGTSINIKIALG